MRSDAGTKIPRWQSIVSRSPLRHCDQIGHDVQCDGTLYVSNLGHISIGDSVEFRSRLAPSHLSTGRAGTLEIGPNVIIQHGAAIAAHMHVTIAQGALIGPFAMIMDTDFHQPGRHEVEGSCAPISIGAGARLGPRVIVLRGTTIGDGAVVGAGSVVKGSVPAGARVVGNPARPIRDRAPTPALSVSWEAVATVIKYSLGLDSLPAPSVRPEDLDRWDSLGALNLMLALEQRFDIDIGADSLSSVETLGDVLSALQDAAARAVR